MKKVLSSYQSIYPKGLDRWKIKPKSLAFFPIFHERKVLSDQISELSSRKQEKNIQTHFQRKKMANRFQVCSNMSEEKLSFLLQ